MKHLAHSGISASGCSFLFLCEPVISSVGELFFPKKMEFRATEITNCPEGDCISQNSDAFAEVGNRCYFQCHPHIGRCWGAVGLALSLVVTYGHGEVCGAILEGPRGEEPPPGQPLQQGHCPRL